MIPFLYRLCWTLLKPFIPFYLNRRLKRGKEDAIRLNERYGITNLQRPEGKTLLWCHGASVGESLSVLTLLEKLLDKNPQLQILFTTCTKTSADLLAKKLPNRAFHQYLPLDHPKWVSDFLDHWQPEGMIWLESELWPNVLAEVKSRHIPALLLNGRMSARSFAQWKRLKGFSRAILSSFNIIYAQSQLYLYRFSELGGVNVQNQGNLKYTTQPLAYDPESLKQMQKMLSSRKFWLFASTHPSEEELAFETHAQLKQINPNLITLIALRHPRRADSILELATQHNLTVQSHSNRPIINKATDIYLIDTIGDLGLFFALSNICVMGGSFIPHGGHNPIEPAHFGNAILIGPSYFNFKDIVEDFVSHQAILITENQARLMAQLTELLATGQPNKRPILAKNAADFVKAQQKIMPQTLKAVTSFFNQQAQLAEKLKC